MDGAVRLGGNIELFGIEGFDGAKMVVLKKIIGTYARKFSDKGAEKLSISFAGTDVTVEVVMNGSSFSSISNHPNVFFSVDAALKDVEKQF